MDADGSNVVRLTHGSGSEVYLEPSWSPDGRRMAYISNRGREAPYVYDVYIMDVDGSDVVRLTQGSGSDQSWSPSWSPDGRRIVFVSNRDRNDHVNRKFDIFVMDADGSGVTPLTHSPEFVDNLWPELDLGSASRRRALSASRSDIEIDQTKTLYSVGDLHQYPELQDGQGIQRSGNGRGDPRNLRFFRA